MMNVFVSKILRNIFSKTIKVISSSFSCFNTICIGYQSAFKTGYLCAVFTFHTEISNNFRNTKLNNTTYFRNYKS